MNKPPAGLWTSLWSKLPNHDQIKPLILTSKEHIQTASTSTSASANASATTSTSTNASATETSKSIMSTNCHVKTQTQTQSISTRTSILQPIDVLIIIISYTDQSQLIGWNAVCGVDRSWLAASRLVPNVVIRYREPTPHSIGMTGVLHVLKKYPNAIGIHGFKLNFSDMKRLLHLTRSIPSLLNTLQSLSLPDVDTDSNTVNYLDVIIWRMLRTDQFKSLNIKWDWKSLLHDDGLHFMDASDIVEYCDNIVIGLIINRHRDSRAIDIPIMYNNHLASVCQLCKNTLFLNVCEICGTSLYHECSTCGHNPNSSEQTYVCHNKYCGLTGICESCMEACHCFPSLTGWYCILCQKEGVFCELCFDEKGNSLVYNDDYDEYVDEETKDQQQTLQYEHCLSSPLTHDNIYDTLDERMRQRTHKKNNKKYKRAL